VAETAVTETKAKPPERIAINFQLDEKLIDAATIRPSTFASYADCISAAHQMTTPSAFSWLGGRPHMLLQLAPHQRPQEVDK
jgi:hypothetical protein